MEKPKISAFVHGITWIFYALLAILLLVGFWKQSSFLLWEGALTVATVTALYILQLWPKTRLPIGLYGAFLLFVFCAMVLGKIGNWYGIFPLWDKLLHFLSGVILAFLGCLICARVGESSRLLLLFGLVFSIAMAGAWEIFEFSGDSLLGLHAQNDSLQDTMWDIICGTVGAVIYTGLIYIKKRLFEK